ncbi:MAG TPA: hypothetical protein VG167_19665 [Verrucomicrobiae bacterium]|nr:hypothetical protein [Verrucomicrobiae bacterium]
MNLDQLQRRLLAAARVQTPSERVPYGFERRVMGRLRAVPALDSWALWAQALWRAAAPCVGIMLVLGAWTLLAPPAKSTTADFSQQLENTVFATADQEQVPADLLR